MELWIRSQDKKKLLRSTSFGLDNDETTIFANNYDGDYVNAGKYKTKERALEVLDEIQSILILKDMYEYDRELVLKSWENTDEEQVKIVRQQMSVYEMPQE